MTETKITPAQVEARIAATRFYYDGLLTIAVVETHAGFKAVGYASAVHEAHYSREEGEKFARQKALAEIYAAVAFERLENAAKPHPVEMTWGAPFPGAQEAFEASLRGAGGKAVLGEMG